MAKCLLCGKAMATIKAQVNKKGTPVRYGLRYSCRNKQCEDYDEQYVRQGYPSDAKVKEIRSKRTLPYRK